MVTELILTRHGETDWNRTGRMQGQSDSKLNENGLQQAQLLANRLKTEHLDAIWSSDLSRALDTAEMVNRFHGLTIQTTSDLREMDLGDWEGFDFSQIKERWPEVLASYERDPKGTRIPGGETAGEVAQRTIGVIEQLGRRYREKRVLVVTHAGPIRTILAELLGASPSSRAVIGQDNTAINIVRLNDSGRWIIHLVNDSAHLREEPWRQGDSPWHSP